MVFPAGTALAMAVAGVAARAREVLGEAAGEVRGVRDGEGVVGVGRWEQGVQGTWTVAIEWAW